MIEGSGAGSIPLTNGSGSGRPRNMWIRIRNADNWEQPSRRFTPGYRTSGRRTTCTPWRPKSAPSDHRASSSRRTSWSESSAVGRRYRSTSPWRRRTITWSPSWMRMRRVGSSSAEGWTRWTCWRIRWRPSAAAAAVAAATGSSWPWPPRWWRFQDRRRGATMRGRPTSQVR